MNTSAFDYKKYNNLKIGDVVLTKYFHNGNMCVAIVTNNWYYEYRFIIKRKIIQASRFYTFKIIGSDDPITYINQL